jgi:hypothetical protein
MRKVISLGLSGLLFALISGQVFAGNIEECDFLKDKKHPDYQPGLYGLCVAWHNADDNAADLLADKFFERAGFVVPGSEDPNTEPSFDCPCWSDVEFSAVCALGEATSVVVSPQSGLVTAVTFVDFATFDANNFGTAAPACSHVEQNLVTGEVYINNTITNLTPDEALDCQAELDVIAMIHLNNECPEE